MKKIYHKTEKDQQPHLDCSIATKKTKNNIHQSH